jgi:uncharacterized membrane protein YoaK (UPF0700 family)
MPTIELKNYRLTMMIVAAVSLLFVLTILAIFGSGLGQVASFFWALVSFALVVFLRTLISHPPYTVSLISGCILVLVAILLIVGIRYALVPSEYALPLASVLLTAGSLFVGSARRPDPPISSPGGADQGT